MRIGVYGAGAVGGYVGVRLAAAGHDVTLLGRPWLKELGALEAQDLGREPVFAHPEVVHEVDALRGCEVVLVTVKSRHSVAAGQDLAGLEVPIVSLQNGLHNATRVADAAGRAVTPGMVPFNVIVEGRRFRKATSMPLQLQDDAVGQALARAWRSTGEAVQLVEDMRAVQAGKLLFNLGNGLCAATGLRIQQMLRDRTARRVLARCMAEGVAAFRANAVPIQRLGPLPGWAVARLLPLPDVIVLNVARSIIQIDAAAMSSTLQDLHAGKPTEIDDLNGEIVRLAPDHSPVNRRIVQAVKGLEGGPLDFVDPSELLG